MSTVVDVRGFVDANSRTRQSQLNRTKQIFENPGSYTALDRPRARRDPVVRANPYAFSWASDPLREQALQMICSGRGHKTDYTAKDVLRLMLYLWRAAQQRQSLHLPALRGYRWRWESQDYLSGVLQMDRSMLKKTMRRLIDLGLIVRVYETGQMGSRTAVSHYRPSDDLFRLCLKLTMFSDAGYIRATNTGMAAPTDAEMKSWRRVMEHAFAAHGGTVQDVVRAFVASDDDNRARVMSESMENVLNTCLDETGMSTAEYDEMMEGYYEEE